MQKNSTDIIFYKYDGNIKLAKKFSNNTLIIDKLKSINLNKIDNSKRGRLQIASAFSFKYLDNQK